MQDNHEHKLKETESSPERYTDEVTQSKIHKHLTDVNDSISAQDILNIDTNISSPNVPNAGNSETEELPPVKTDKDDNKDNDEDNRGQLPTTWNVLD